MSRFRRFHLIEEEPFFCNAPSFFAETLTFPSFVDHHSLDLDLIHFDAVTDLICVDPAPPSFAYRRVQRLDRRQLETEHCLQSLSDRVAELETRFDRLLVPGGKSSGDRKYTWTAEIKGAEKNGFDRKYKWVAEVVAEEEKKKREKSKLKSVALAAKNIKWTAEIKGKGDDAGSLRKYTFEVGSGDDEKKKKEKKGNVKETKEKKKGNGLRIVEIQETNDATTDHRVVVLRQAFAKRFGAVQNERGKKKELSPQDAALLIQISFRAYLIRRSKALRALRELAVAKSKLKELRAQFNNFAYRRHVARDAEERQRFTEKIIVLLLTVDGIEGSDLMVRSAKRSMVDELEAMLDVVDPQPGGKSLSFRRRTFDMPDGVIRKEIEEGVAQVVRMLDEAENSSDTY